MILDPTNITVGDICSQALRECGALGLGQDPTGIDLTEAQARLQFMLQQWERERWLVWHLVTFGIVSTGAQSYTFGPGGQINTNALAAYGVQSLGLVAPGAGYAPGDTVTLEMTPVPPTGGSPPQITVETVTAGGAIATFTVSAAGAIPSPLPTLFSQQATSGAGAGATWNLPIFSALPSPIMTTGGSVRPAKVASAFLRQLTLSQPNQIDYPLTVLQSREDYNRIALKQLMSFPGWIFWDSAWPLGNVLCYPVPQANIYSINISVMEQMPTSFPTPATRLNLPYEYYAAILYNLAIRLRPKYSLTTFPGDPLPILAKDSLNVLRGANVQIPSLSMPKSLMQDHNYNIYSDQFY